MPEQLRISYVTQDSHLVVSETVLDVMWFYASLSLPRKTTVRDKRRLIDDILFAMDMSHTVDTYVGGVESAYEVLIEGGLSSGERRRLQVRPCWPSDVPPASEMNLVAHYDFLWIFVATHTGRLDCGERRMHRRVRVTHEWPSALKRRGVCAGCGGACKQATDDDSGRAHHWARWFQRASSHQGAAAGLCGHGNDGTRQPASVPS